MPLFPVKGFDPQLRAKSNREIVTNRQDLRIANINAAQLMKEELNSSSTRDPQSSMTPVQTANTTSEISSLSTERDTEKSSNEVTSASKRKADELDDEIPIEDEVKDDNVDSIRY